MTFYDLKMAIEAYTGLERDALHIHAALLLYVTTTVILRNGRSVIPWLVVLVVEVANEAYDLRHNWPEGPDWAISSSVKDLWNTMIWPTALLLVAWSMDWQPASRRRASADHSPVLEPDDEIAGEDR